MVGAFVDPVIVPQMSVAMETYPAALPKRLFSGGLGRNMTMYIVMKRYIITKLRSWMIKGYFQPFNVKAILVPKLRM